jgi:hypothetical protein
VIKSKLVWFFVDIAAHAAELQRQKKSEQAQVSEEDKIGLGKLGGLDTEIYGGSNKYEGYYDSIAPNEEADVSFQSLIIFNCQHLIVKINLGR